MHDLLRIVLASASPRRLALLASLGLEIRVRPTNVAEDDVPGLTPLQLAERHARAKALAGAAAAAAGELVLAADTVVDVDGVSLGKPASVAQAAAMLEQLSGRAHLVHTSLVLATGAGGPLLQRTSSTRVWFYPLGAAVIERYARCGEPLDKAGGYGIQGLGATLVERIEGDFYTVMGLPLGLFARMAEELGFELPALATAEAVA